MIKQRQGSSYTILVLILMVGFGLLVGCGNNESGQQQSGEQAIEEQQTATEQPSAEAQTFETALQGANEVPPVTTDASGSVTVTLQGDSIHVEGQFSGLSSNYVASHIHKGGENENGGVIIPLEPTINQDSSSGSWNEYHMVTESQIADLQADSLYINVHSAEHKPGEIRGQLTASPGM